MVMPAKWTKGFARCMKTYVYILPGYGNFCWLYRTTETFYYRLLKVRGMKICSYLRTDIKSSKSQETFIFCIYVSLSENFIYTKHKILNQFTESIALSELDNYKKHGTNFYVI